MSSRCIAIFFTGLVLGCLTPAFGDETVSMCNEALAIVRNAEKPDAAERSEALNRALKLVQEAPNHRLKGHRIQAIQNIRAALAEIQKGDPDHKAQGFLQTAEAELKMSAELAAAPSPTPQVQASPTLSIHEAAYKGDLVKVKELLQSDPNLVFTKGSFEFTPLIEAVSAGHLEIVKLLLAYKSDVNTCDNVGLTPLHLAAMSNYKEIAELLLSSGADINARGKHAKFWTGDTPLWIAACNGHLEVARVLLAHKADPSIPGEKGQTPLRIALANSHQEMAELLKNFSPSPTPEPIPPPSEKAAGEMITRLLANASKKPPGPVENDIAPSAQNDFRNLMELSKKNKWAIPSLRESIAEQYNFFTLEGSPAIVCSSGTYALFSAPVKLSNKIAHSQPDDLPLNPDNTIVFGTAGWVYLADKVKADGHVIATFCFVYEQGSWKPQGFYITNGPLSDEQKKIFANFINEKR